MEEGFVLEDRTAQRTTELVLTKLRFRSMRAELVRGRVQLVVAEEFIQRAVEAVRTALGDDVDHRAGRPAYVRREGVGNDANFLDGINAGAHTNGDVHALVLVQAIDHLVVQRLGLAVHRDRRTGPAIVGAGTNVYAVGRGFVGAPRV